MRVCACVCVCCVCKGRGLFSLKWFSLIGALNFFIKYFKQKRYAMFQRQYMFYHENTVPGKILVEKDLNNINKD